MINMERHILAPEHIKLTKEEKDNILTKHNISIKQLPRILESDPAIKSLEAKPGELIMIKRNSQTARESFFYRVVVHG